MQNTLNNLAELNKVLEQLLDEEKGCPWDKKQTPDSLTEYLICETHELVSAIRSGQATEVCDELGDVFFLLLFVAKLYAQQGKFSLAEVLEQSKAKMIRRHPHVFGDTVYTTQEEHLKNWDAIKKKEKEGKPAAEGYFADLPLSLPALAKAWQIHKKAAKIGFTWETDSEVEQQVEVEWLEWLDVANAGDEQAKKHELGDLLFSIVELGRRHGIKANEALDLATIRFLQRFATMEKLAKEQNKDFAALSLDDKDELWNLAKEAEKNTMQNNSRQNNAEKNS